MVVGILQETSHLRPDNRIYGEERAEDHYVIAVDFGIYKFKLVVGMVLVEYVVGVVVLVEESQRDGGL